MKKFILKSSLFVIPFFILYVLNLVLYAQGEGDLTRVGFIYNNPSPKSTIINQFDFEINYKKLSELDLDTTSVFQFDVLTIGDSFSNQGFCGYVNLLANDDKAVLNFDKFLTQDNPIQKLIELANGNFFERIKTKYIILETVERMFYKRCEKLNFSKSISINMLNARIDSYEPRKPAKRDMKFFSNTTLKMPLTNIQYLYTRNPPNSLTYKVKTKTIDLFSGSTNNLLFTKHDITFKEKYNHDLNVMIQCNSQLNELSRLLKEIGIELILLICPDKYDLYYPHIKNKAGLMKPFFFKNYRKLNREYLYVNSMQILSDELKKSKDVYFYDDTHWSPVGAKAVTYGIQQLIESNSSNN
jgi:hypothetical protein